ncbi:S8 family serine peptidase [Aurantiacibacter sp. MUD11]|uniref:S8 family serine peptidase n=1 Tax=Aurantiacibacter sp. MUD11 TaxID=3003265 RepID=UPI0022AB1EA9|nr:S8 family serine peptidase [Aurantiacibacter sp. MUD11]WAT17653.1 S8 family serine peptidase [Aurantiacibacter sp. MUD11]
MPDTNDAAAFDLNASPDQLLEEALASGQAPFTGRQIVTFDEELDVQGMTAQLASFGPAAVASDFGDEMPTREKMGDAASLVLEQLHLAILVPSAVEDFGAAAVGGMERREGPQGEFMIEPETFAFAINAIEDNADATWGLQATRVLGSNWTGAGIKVAVLDTGMDLGHPDFAGRPMTSASFIPGQSVQDGHGHGTHCIGTACGPYAPDGGVPRYSIAHEAEIFAGKVLSNSGSGSAGGILAGINWAIANNCEVISMSLGAAIPVQGYYTAAMQRALAAGSLVIAASGNDSRRPGQIVPTGAPANSPGAVAVAALDNRLDVASFSNGGKIEIAAPGVGVFSSLPRPRLHASWSGTSMATPHVAGVAALLAQSDPTLRGQALADRLQALARSLPHPATDVGAGLVQAP